MENGVSAAPSQPVVNCPTGIMMLFFREFMGTKELREKPAPYFILV